MFVSDFLPHFSSNNKDEEPIPYLTDTSCLDNASYMSHLCHIHSLPNLFPERGRM